MGSITDYLRNLQITPTEIPNRIIKKPREGFTCKEAQHQSESIIHFNNHAGEKAQVGLYSLTAISGIRDLVFLSLSTGDI